MWKEGEIIMMSCHNKAVIVATYTGKGTGETIYKDSNGYFWAEDIQPYLTTTGVTKATIDLRYGTIRYKP